MLDVRWVRDLGSLEALQEPWEALEREDKGRTIFATWRYRMVWYRNRAGERPLVAGVWDDATLVGLGAFTEWKGTLGGVPIRRVDFSGHQVYQGEILASREQERVRDLILGSLMKNVRCDAMMILGPDGAAADAERLVELGRAHRFQCERTPHHFSVVDLEKGYDAYFAGRTSQFRTNVRNRERKIAALGGAEVEVVGRSGESEAQVHAAMDRVSSILDRSWRPKESGPRAPNADRIERATSVEFAKTRQLELSFLRIDGKDVAFYQAVREGETLYDIAIGFDDAYKAVGPGTVLLQRVLKAAAAGGVRRLVTHGPYPYKKFWASRRVDQSRYLFFAPTIRGRLARYFKLRVAPRIAAIRKSRWDKKNPGADSGTV